MGIKKRTIKVSQELAAFICDFVFVDYIMALRNKYSFLMPFAQFDFMYFGGKHFIHKADKPVLRFLNTAL